MRFTDLRSAGLALSSKLEAYRGREDALVLALARGGVAVGLEVAKHLRLPLDILLIRRLLVPHGPDAPLCAVSFGGSLFVDEEVAARTQATHDAALEHFIADALGELAHSERACRGQRPPIDLKGKTVLLVDNGICTGSTMRVAIRALRSSVPARVVAAVPVAASEALAGVEAAADELVCLASPEPFGHVGLWYADFKRPTDDEIQEMLEESERELKGASKS
ncbi:MAG: putative phosphoribosyl transferase [Acidobacteriota bacterium]|jgi:putative phosphoribosyl transferase|nr:putative phosphoribosyl transferase [Acidobacteriota bacterium]